VKRLFLCLLALAPATAQSAGRNFAGSIQLDYHFVPGEPGGLARGGLIDGFTTEAAFKVAADISDRISANAKVCYGCHGFELPMAYFDFRPFDELNIRAGRFSPSFGAFNLRHDPANHALSSKPLPYDMGRMQRLADWNMSVLPSPFPDNGVEIGGTHWFGERAQLDYAVYAVTGFKAAAGSVDLDWTRSFSGFRALDNNSRPTVGGRLAVTLRLGSESDLTLGGSGMRGNYDDENRLAYTIFGGDLSLRLNTTHIRLEYVGRLHELEAVADEQLLEPLADGARQTIGKHGAYLEVVGPATRWLDVVARVDGMHRRGNNLATSTVGTRAAIVRYSLGTVISLAEGWRVKSSAEVWTFYERLGGHPDTELGLHLAAVGTF
jgi:hypothetical protein